MYFVLAVDSFFLIYERIKREIQNETRILTIKNVCSGNVCKLAQT